jgi:putative SOS response-associated peptidase YedK
MCNLYTVRASPAAIADYFKAKVPTAFNAGEGEVYPGGQGMVVREEASERILQSMAWGWPMPQKSKKTGLPIKPKAVNNIANPGKFPWHLIASRPERRCIIPLTGFCEAEGEEGRKDPNLVQRARTADLRLGRHVGPEPRMGRLVFRPDDRLQRGRPTGP